jgi:hypothetical protein
MRLVIAVLFPGRVISHSSSKGSWTLASDLRSLQLRICGPIQLGKEQAGSVLENGCDQEPAQENKQRDPDEQVILPPEIGGLPVA